MIQSLGTLLARSHRQKKGLPFFEITTAEMVLPIVAACEQTDCSAVICLNQQRLSEVVADALLAYILEIVAASKVKLGVEVSLLSEKEPIIATFQAGAPAICLAEGYLGRASQLEFAHWAARLAKEHRKEVGGVVEGLLSLNRIESYVKTSGVSNLTVEVSVRRKNERVISKAYIQQIASTVKVPLIARESDLEFRQLKVAIASGVVGFRVSEELTRAFTAGLRTSLRDRSQVEPVEYFKKAQLAVHQVAKQYLHV